MKDEESRYIYLTTIYKRCRIYIDDVYRPDSMKVRVECYTSGSYTLTFLKSVQDFPPKDEEYMRIVQRNVPYILDFVRDVCIYLTRGEKNVHFEKIGKTVIFPKL